MPTLCLLSATLESTTADLCFKVDMQSTSLIYVNVEITIRNMLQALLCCLTCLLLCQTYNQQPHQTSAYNCTARLSICFAYPTLKLKSETSCTWLLLLPFQIAKRQIASMSASPVARWLSSIQACKCDVPSDYKCSGVITAARTHAGMQLDAIQSYTPLNKHMRNTTHAHVCALQHDEAQ